MATLPKCSRVAEFVKGVTKDQWKCPETQKQAFLHLEKDLNIQKHQDWYTVSNQQIVNLGGRKLIDLYGNSLSTALFNVFPDTPWDILCFKTLPRNYWQSKKNQRNYLNYYAIQNNFQTLEDWYNVDTQTIIASKGRALIYAYSDNLPKALMMLYPNFPWSYRKFKRLPKTYWKMTSHIQSFVRSIVRLFQIRKKHDFYRISSPQMTKLQAEGVVRRGGLAFALEKMYPKETWDLQLFKVVAKKSTQRLTYIYLSNLFSNHQLLEDYSHPKFILRTQCSAEFDIYIPSFNLVVEYYGEHHYIDSTYCGGAPIEMIKDRDDEKKSMLENQHHYLVIVPHTWNRSLPELYSILETSLSQSNFPLCVDPLPSFSSFSPLRAEMIRSFPTRSFPCSISPHIITLSSLLSHPVSSSSSSSSMTLPDDDDDEPTDEDDEDVKALESTLTPSLSSSVAASGSGSGRVITNVNEINCKVMLSGVWEPKIDPTGYWISDKFDGIRALWDGEALWSKSGERLRAPHFFLSFLPEGVWCDGELWGGLGKFGRTNYITKEHDRPWEELRFKVFDAPLIPGKPSLRFEERLEYLHQNVSENLFVNLVEHRQCLGYEDLTQQLQLSVNEGGEGIMLRKPNSLYEPGRSLNLLKVKQTLDNEVRMIKASSSSISFIVEMPNRKIISVKCSKEEFSNPPPPGTILTVAHYGLWSRSKKFKYPYFLRIVDGLVWEQVVSDFQRSLELYEESRATTPTPPSTPPVVIRVPSSKVDKK